MRNIRLKSKKSMHNLPIRKKLSKSFRYIWSLGILVTLIVVLFLIKTNYDYKYAIKNYGYSQGTIGKLGMEFNNQKALLSHMGLCVDDLELREINKDLTRNIQNVSDILSELGKTIKIEEERNIYAKLTDDSLEYRKIRERVVNLYLEGKPEEGSRLLREKEIQFQKKFLRI